VSEFDSLAEDYELALSHNLRLIPGGIEHYYRNRANITARYSKSTRVSEILDFGGGVGLAIPHLAKSFPGCALSIADSSMESVRVAKSRFPFLRVVEAGPLPPESWDLIFVAGVLHHIPPVERDLVVERLCGALRIGGTLAIFELNPLNPITRRLVDACPFDEDASLIRKPQVKQLFDKAVQLRLVKEGFTIFFPPAMKHFHCFERALTWCPMGAQYYLIFEKNK
jgi:SAM-dependent methyltransferase